jgi:hypothetical protein
MSTTIHLGAYGFGNLGDELCLMEAIKAFPAEKAYACSFAPEWTMRCVPNLTGCFTRIEDLFALKPERVVFGGGMIGTSDMFREYLPLLDRAAQGGIEVHLHNLGVARLTDDITWRSEAALRAIARAITFTVRDYTSFEMAVEADIDRLPKISFFPETDMPPDFTMADGLLPRGRKLLGISIATTPRMQAAIHQDSDVVRGLLVEFADHAIVPIISTMHLSNEHENDIAGFIAFVREFMPHADVVAPVLLDRDHWHAHATPARLKGLIGRCDVLLTQREQNVVQAVGAGVRVIGLHPMAEHSLLDVFIALGHRLPPGSRRFGLGAAPEEAVGLGAAPEETE